MKYLNGDDGVGGLYEDLDGNLYEWVEGYERVDGIDEWGEVDDYGDYVGDPQRDLDGLGALHEAPDGTMYQVHGLSEEEADSASAASSESASPAAEDAERAPPMAPGRPGQIRVGPGGHRYRWVRGMNAQGRPMGFWRRMRPAAGPTRRPVHPQRGGGMRSRPAPGGRARPRGKGGGFLKKLLPIAKLATRLIPVPGAGAAVRAGINVAAKLIKPRGVADDGLGALYAAADGTVYQMQGIADDEMRGIAASEPMDGFVNESETFADDFGGSTEIDGLSAPQCECPTILSADDGAVSGADPGAIEGYVREQPARTRWFAEPTERPALWKPFW